MKFLDPQPGERILDVGCGLGYFVSLMNQVGVTPYGVDFSIESVSLASRQTQGHYSSSSADALPFADDSFDKVLFTDVIEHLENDEGAVSEIARVAKDGATVVVSTPPLEGLLVGTRLNLLCHENPDMPEYHVRPGYKTKELVALLCKYGIEVEAVRYSTVLLGELFIEGLKVLYTLRKGKLESQADAVDVTRSKLFKIYALIVFPVMFWVSKFEEKLLARFLKGHVVIVHGARRR